jgi:hypothetical protein
MSGSTSFAFRVTKSSPMLRRLATQSRCPAGLISDVAFGSPVAPGHGVTRAYLRFRRSDPLHGAQWVYFSIYFSS